MMGVVWRPDERQLRGFARGWLAGFAAVGLLVAWRIGALRGDGAWTVPLILWAAAATVGVSGIIVPRVVRPVYVAWTAMTLPIAWVVTHTVLAAAYFGVFTPFAVAFRLLGRDALKRRFEPEAATYWLPRSGTESADRYFRQF